MSNHFTQLIRIFSVTALLICYQVFCESPTNVIFSQSLKTKNVLAAFISSSCPISRHFLKTWKQLENLKLPTVGAELKMVLVNCKKYTDFCVTERVKFYPTIRLYPVGDSQKPHTFKGRRSIQRLVSFVAKAQLAIATGASEETEDVTAKILSVGGVTQLTDENFLQATRDGFVFVKFYTDWCPHCKQVQPLFANLPAAVKAAELQVAVAEVNCEQQQDVCNKQEISHYPAFWLFAFGRQVAAYDDEHSVQHWVAFLRTQLQKQNAQQLIDGALPHLYEALSSEAVQLTQDNFHAKLSSASVAFVKFYAPWCAHCQRLAPTWTQLAQSASSELGASVLIGSVDCTQQAALCNQHKIKGYPTLLLFHGTEVADAYKGLRDLHALLEFVRLSLQKRPALDEL